MKNQNQELKKCFEKNDLFCFFHTLESQPKLVFRSTLDDDGHASQELRDIDGATVVFVQESEQTIFERGVGNADAQRLELLAADLEGFLAELLVRTNSIDEGLSKLVDLDIVD